MGNKESNCILQETLTLVETMLGEEIDTLTVERAVLGLLHPGSNRFEHHGSANSSFGVCSSKVSDSSNLAI
jgi:hypothetical protein